MKEAHFENEHYLKKNTEAVWSAAGSSSTLFLTLWCRFVQDVTEPLQLKSFHRCPLLPGMISSK